MTSLNPGVRTERPSRLSAFLGVEAGEARPVASMVGLNLAVSSAFVLVQTSAFGLFIESFGSHSLPYAYFSVAILSSLIAYLYLQVSQRVSFSTGLYINLAFLVTVCMVFWLGLRSPQARWFIFLLPFWFQTLTNLANLVVWHLSGHVFHVRQAKRVFGLIVAGNWIANIVGGVLVASLLGGSSPSELYLLAALALAISMLVLRGALRHYRPAQAAARTSPAPDSGGAAARAALSHPYTRLIFAYTLLWWLAFFILENIFFHQVEGQFESSAALAGFLGWQLAVMGVIALFTTSVLTSRVARRYGLRLGLLVMPIVVTFSIALLAFGGRAGWSTGFLFWTATTARTLNIALGFSLSQAMGSLLFQPLQGQLRSAAQTISEGIVQPLAIGLAGVILLIFNTTLGLDTVGLAYIFLVVALPWLWSIFALTRRYPLVMSDALKKRVLGESTTVLFDSSTLGLLRRALRQPQSGQALYALNQLEQIAPEMWPGILAEELPGLLRHPSVDVRLEVLRRVLRFTPPNAAQLIRERLDQEAEPRVAAMLIRVLAAVRDPASEPHVLAALNSGDGVLQVGAILGVLSGPPAALTETASTALAALASSKLVQARRHACEILSELRQPAAAEYLPTLIRDSEPGVRQAALRAARQRSDPVLVHAVADAIADPACARLAESALIEIAEHEPEPVLHEARLAKVEGFVSRKAQGILRVLGNLPGAPVVEILISGLDSANPQARLEAALSLSRLCYRAESAPRILDRVRLEVEQAAWLASALDCDDNPPGWKVLRHALEAEFGDTRGRILLLLSFVYDARAVLLARSALQRRGAVHSAMALETIDALLPSAARHLVLPLLEDVAYDARVVSWRAAGLQVPDLTHEAVLLELLSADDASRHAAWTRMCAMHVAGSAHVVACNDALGSGRAASDSLEGMREWALARLAAPPRSKGVEDMLSLVEKVLILKSAPLFAETSDSVLAELADLVEEESFEADQVIFNKGDAGDSLYVIVSGSVKVWDGDRLLNELKEGDAFGELALLDPEPRLGTVRAAEPTHLLRLGASSFSEVLDSQPEVSSAILRVVTKYLRSQLQFAREASARIRALESLTPMVGAG